MELTVYDEQLVPPQSSETQSSENQQSLFVPACCSVSVQYNFSNIATAVYILETEGYSEPSWGGLDLECLVFIGCIIGMLTMGHLGTMIGNRKALLIANALVVFGALLSTFAFAFGSTWVCIVIGRVVIGVGAGGLFPLSAVRASSSTMDLSESTYRAGFTYSWQCFGKLLPYVVAFFLSFLPSSTTSLQWRLLLGLGALPSLVVLYLVGAEEEIHIQAQTGSILEGRMRKWQHWRSLVLTAGTWFLFDIVVYAIVLFTPEILASIFGSESLFTLALEGICLYALAWAGVVAGVFLIQRIGPVWLYRLGFSLQFLLCFLFGCVQVWWSGEDILLFVLLCMLFFCFDFACGLASFTLPVLAYPKDVRSTFHGLSSGIGHVGALVGTMCFPLVSEAIGTGGSVLVLSGISLLGLLPLFVIAVGNTSEEEETIKVL